MFKYYNMYINLILKDFVLENKKEFIYYFISYLCNYTFEFIGIPIILGTLITIIKNNNKMNFEFSLDFRNTFKKNIIYNIILLICFSYVINYIFIDFINYYYSIIHSKIFTFIRIKLNKILIENRKINFKELEVCKDLVSLDLTSQFIIDLIDIYIADIFPFMVFTIILLVVLLYLGIEYFLVFFTGIITITLYILYKKNKIIQFAEEKELVYLKMVNNSENSFNNLSNILINNTSDYEINKNNKLTNDFKIKFRNLYISINSFVFYIRCIFVFFLFILLLLIFKNYKEKKIELSTLIIIIFIITNYIIFFRGKIYKIILSYKYLGQIKVNKKNFDIMIDKKNKNNKNNKINLGNIEFRNIKFKYDNKYIFNNLNLLIKEKEKVGILGKSGSGKSTLIKLLLRFYPLESGQILIDNIDISKFDLDYLRQNIYYINQNTNLFNETVYYNISYGLKNNENSSNKLNKYLIDEFLKKQDLYNIFDKLEKGLESNSGPNGTNLSLGMQKVVLLVRGLLACKERGHKIVIFDEPLTALDKNSREKVIKMIMEECNDKTLIIITHDTEIVPHMDRIVNLKDLL